MRKIFYIFIIILLVVSCATTQEQKPVGSNSFRDVPPELKNVKWDRTPNDVIANPIKDEPLIWVGLVKEVTVSKKGEEIEIEWLCEHLAFNEPGPASITVRPIAVHKGSGYFALSLVSKEMPWEQALKFKQEHTSSPHYVLVGGTFYSFIERNGRKVPFIYTLQFGMGPELAKIVK